VKVDILSKFKAQPGGGDEWKALCPAHDDHVPSLSLKEQDGKWLLYCHAKCTPEAICKAAGIEMSDLFSDNHSAPIIIAKYDYTDENGLLLFQVVRYEPKNFKQRRPDGKGGWIWDLKGVQRILYRLPEVLEAESVLVVEGEKDSETGRKLEFVATCNPCGAGKWREEYSESLKGKQVSIIADADEPGRKHAQQIAESLYGKVQSLKVLELPDAKDLSEWAAKGGKREALLELIRHAPEWKPQPLTWRNLFRSVDELEQGDVRMLIGGFLPEGTTFMGGLPGEGKTLFALSIAKALTTTEPFLGKFSVSEAVPVIYLIPESGGRAFRKRCEKFHIPNDPELFLCRTISEGSTLPLDDASLFEAVRKMKPVVILDTLIRFSEANDENAATENKKLVDDIIRLRQAGAVGVIGLHHATKAIREKGMSLETALRGTGDIAASADAVYGLLRDAMLYSNGAGPNEIDVACLKARDFNPPVPFRIAATKETYPQGPVSVIDQRKDFIIVSKSDREQATGETLERLVKEDPAITLEELTKVTGLSTWTVRQTLKNRHWVKSRGGSKGTNKWILSPVNRLGTENGVTEMPRSVPNAAVSLDLAA
jgi:5S rRNA maturation endonuclease (ribonuclease M5)